MQTLILGEHMLQDGKENAEKVKGSEKLSLGPGTEINIR